jgi:two-component system chemotaxis response regulator CheB
LRELVSHLPGDLRACVLVVLHVPGDSPSALPAILRRVSELPVRQAENGERLRPGEILVAQPDHHLVVADGGVLVTRGPRENGHRPAVDVLFRSAARSCGPRTLALVLSGALDDGASGAVAVASQGGRVAVQDFTEALYSSMPQSAADAVGSGVDQLSLAALADLAGQWAQKQAIAGDAHRAEHPELSKEVEMARMEPDAMHDLDRPGTPSGYGCPDCAGSLYRLEEANLVRYRCRVGHAWSSDSLLARQTVELEGALWVALRSLEEKAALNSELGERATLQGHDRTARLFGENMREAIGAAELVRQLITRIGKTVEAPDDSGQTTSG